MGSASSDRRVQTKATPERGNVHPSISSLTVLGVTSFGVCSMTVGRVVGIRSRALTRTMSQSV